MLGWVRALLVIHRIAALPVLGHTGVLLVLTGPLVLVFSNLLALGMSCGRGVTVLLVTGWLGGGAVLHAVSPLANWRGGFGSRIGTMQSRTLDRRDACVRSAA